MYIFNNICKGCITSIDELTKIEKNTKMIPCLLMYLNNIFSFFVEKLFEI